MFGSRRLRPAFAAGFLFVSFATLAPAYAAPVLFTFRGVVADKLGRPLSGSTVSDGNQSVVTGADGAYVLEETSTGRYTLSASHQGMYTDYRTVNESVPADAVINFSLLYSLTYDSTPNFFSSLPGTMTLSAVTTAPLTNLCVAVHDFRSGGVIHLSLQYSDASGSHWSGTYTVPATARPGIWNLGFVAFDCTSEAGVTPELLDEYWIDLAPPTVTITSPAVGHSYVGGVDMGASGDEATHAVGMAGVSGVAADDALVTDVEITLKRPDGRTETQRMSPGNDGSFSCATARTTIAGHTVDSGCWIVAQAGEYTVTVRARDIVGRWSAPATRTFIVP